MQQVSRPAARHTGGWILLLIVLVAIGLRFWQLDMLPPGFHDDESFEGLEAWRILNNPDYRPIFLTGSSGVPPMNIYANVVMFRLFQFFGGEAGPFAMRVTAAIFGVLSVLAVFLLAREMTLQERGRTGLSPAFPFFAAATLAVLRWHVHFSRLGIEPILVPLLWALALWLLLRGWRKPTGRGGWLNFVGCGIALAACIYTYQGAWIVPLIIAFVSLHLLLRDYLRLRPNFPEAVEDGLSNTDQLTASGKSRIRGLIIAAGTALLLLAPLVLFFWNNWELMAARPDQVIVVAKGGRSAGARMMDNVWSMAKMFGPFGAPGDDNLRRNIPGAPVLNLWLAIPFYAGIVISLWRFRFPVYAAIFVSLIGLALPGVVSTSAPHFHRTLGLTGPIALLCAFGLDFIWCWRPLRSDVTRWLVMLFLIGALVTTANDYFVRWAAFPRLFYSLDVGYWELSQAMADLPAESPVYLTPRHKPHPTLVFGPESAGRSAPIFFDGRRAFPLSGEENPVAEYYVVIGRDDARSDLLLPELFPDATVEQEILDWEGQPYARIYRREWGTLPARQPQYAVYSQLGDGISITGYDLFPADPAPGDELYVQLYWRVDGQPESDWTVFTHVLGKDAGGAPVLMAGKDSPPGEGSLITTRWQPGWQILDEYKIDLPDDLPPGEYDLEIGLYQHDGPRLPAEGSGLHLGSFSIQ